MIEAELRAAPAILRIEQLGCIAIHGDAAASRAAVGPKPRPHTHGDCDAVLLHVDSQSTSRDFRETNLEFSRLPCAVSWARGMSWGVGDRSWLAP